MTSFRRRVNDRGRFWTGYEAWLDRRWLAAVQERNEARVELARFNMGRVRGRRHG